MQHVREIIDTIINYRLKQLLKEEGYRKTARTFKYRGDDFVRIVNVQASPWNSSNDGKFTVNLGIYFPKLAEIHDFMEVKQNPTESDCLVHERIGFLMPVKRDFWWPVKNTSSAAKLGDELAESWLGYGKPWIDRHSNLREARQFYLDRYHFPYIVSMMSVVLGDLEMATQMANKVIADHPEMFNRVSTWARKYNVKLGSAG